MAIIVPRRCGGTWEGEPVAIWSIEWICRMRGGLVHHTIMIPAALSLPLLRGACSRSCTDNISKWLVLYQNLQFFQSPICLIARAQFVDFFPDSRFRSGWVTSHLSLFPVTKKETRYICHISGKNVTISHTKILFLTCDVFGHILPEKCHILAPPVQNFFEREEMWRFGLDWNMIFCSRLRFVTYLGNVKRGILAKTDGGRFNFFN